MKRFFFHYRKQDGRMSVHFSGSCTPCQDVICKRPCETKRNKRQPYLVMRGFAKDIQINGDTITIL